MFEFKKGNFIKKAKKIDDILINRMFLLFATNMNATYKDDFIKLI